MSDLTKFIYRNRVDPHLEDRARLLFQFHEGSNTVRIGLPFFENVKISEKKGARLATYNPIGRSSSLFAYLGAEARSIKLDFNITVPHLAQRYVDTERKTLALTSKETRNDYLNAVDPPSPKDPILHVADLYETEMSTPENNAYNKQARPSVGTPISGPTPSMDAKHNSRRKAHAAVLEFINLIRSSVINHSERPYDGPPLLILDYGIQYINVPCIAKSYSIKFSDDKGYDTELLMPRVLEVSMDLVEIRTSGPGDFQNTGWESTVWDLQQGNNPQIIKSNNNL
jgi:hypothetical protein